MVYYIIKQENWSGVGVYWTKTFWPDAYLALSVIRNFWAYEIIFIFMSQIVWTYGRLNFVVNKFEFLLHEAMHSL